MNHIHDITAQLEAAKAEVRALREGLYDIVGYCTSSKFATDPYVNAQDIVLRVREVESASIDAMNSAWVEAACRLSGHVWLERVGYRIPRQCERCGTYETADHTWSTVSWATDLGCRVPGCPVQYLESAHPSAA